MWERYPPTPPFYCGENEIQASLISSASVGATPTPATNLGRCSGCRSVKPVSKITVGSDDWSITSTSHHFWIRSSTSQSNPLSAGRLRVRVPSDPPAFAHSTAVGVKFPAGLRPGRPFYRSVAQPLERRAWDPEVAGENPAAPTISKCCRGRNRRGVRLLNELMQVQLLPAAPINHCQVVSK